MFHIPIINEQAMLDFGHRIGRICPPGTVIYLEGSLGAGKTTLARGILRGLGYTGFVKSPSYTLIETYTILKGVVVHTDLYRLSDPSELYYLGLEDYCQEEAILLVEWAKKGEAFLPAPSLRCEIKIEQQIRHIQYRTDLKPIPTWLDQLNSSF